LHRDDVAEGLVRAARLLLHPEVRRRQVQLQAGGRRDRPERVVYRQLDVMGLAPAGDLARLGEAAGDAEVDARVVDPLLLDQLAELPLRAELLARRQRDAGAPPERLKGVGVLRAQRVLDEEGVELLDLAAEP